MVPHRTLRHLIWILTAKLLLLPYAKLGNGQSGERRGRENLELTLLFLTDGYVSTGGFRESKLHRGCSVRDKRADCAWFLCTPVCLKWLMVSWCERKQWKNQATI